MKRIRRFLSKFHEGMGVLLGCQANLFVRIAAIPVMLVIVTMCCVLDLIDGEEVE